jgi:hypothetical protein
LSRRRRGTWPDAGGEVCALANSGGTAEIVPRSPRRRSHTKVTTTLAIYTHLFDDDHAETMAALEAMSRPAAPNVVPMRRRG